MIARSLVVAAGLLSTVVCCRADNLVPTGGGQGQVAQSIVKAGQQGAEVITSPMNGTGDDAPAFSKARARALPGTEIRVANGVLHLSRLIGGGPEALVTWNLDAVSYDPAGNAPVIAINHDLVENYLRGGTKFFGRGSESASGAGPVLRVDRNFGFAGGRYGYVAPAALFDCDIKAAPEDFVWCNQTLVKSRAAGRGQHLAIAGSIFRPADALADGKGPRAEIWGGYFENNDQTGKSSSEAGAQVGIENDVFNNGPDPGGNRILLHMNVGKSDAKGAPGEVKRGITIGSSDGQSSVGTGYEITAPFSVGGFDTTGAKALGGAPAFRMASGQRFCFDKESQLCMLGAPDHALNIMYGPAVALQLVAFGGLQLSNYPTDPPSFASKVGAVYFNTTSNALRMFNGKAWTFVAPQSGAPASSHAACVEGERRFDKRYSYICVASDEWRREKIEAF